MQLQNNLYLSFFHTRLERPEYPVRYYMGAFTFIFTNQSSFISSISPFPILSNLTYSGAWAYENLDYVVYPIGLIWERELDLIWVSAGHQDNRGLVMKFNRKSLLKSMHVVPIM